MVTQLDPALSRLFVVVLGQQPKVLEAHATVVVPTLAGADAVRLDTPVVGAAVTVDRVLIVVAQLDPALSRLLTVVPGQQPKELDPQTSKTELMRVGGMAVVRDIGIVVFLGASVERVFGQFEPCLSRLCLAVPGQHPKVLETHPSVVIPLLTAAVVFAARDVVSSCGAMEGVVGQFEPSLSRFCVVVPGQHPKELEVHAVVRGMAIVVTLLMMVLLQQLLTVPKIRRNNCHSVGAQTSKLSLLIFDKIS